MEDVGASLWDDGQWSLPAGTIYTFLCSPAAGTIHTFSCSPLSSRSRVGLCDQQNEAEVMVCRFWYWIINATVVSIFFVNSLSLVTCSEESPVTQSYGGAHMVKSWSPRPTAAWVSFKEILQLQSSFWIASAPTDYLTAASCFTWSQKYEAKPLSDCWSSETVWDNKCLLL